VALLFFVFVRGGVTVYELRKFAKGNCAAATLKSALAVCVLAVAAASSAVAADMTVTARLAPIDRSLLEPQGEPDCKFKGPLSNPITAEEMRMKLDYEQQCYRQAEEIVRARLQQLQDSVRQRNRIR
jgi:hypothetical protein